MDKSKFTNKKVLFTPTGYLFICAIILLATTLRSPITSVGSITPFIREQLHISYSLAGFLTTIPLLAFACISPFAPKVANRFSIQYTLFYALLLLGIGIILRSLGSISTLLIGTIFIGIAIAFGNVLVPSYLKMSYPLHIGLLMGCYSVSMNISGGLSAGVSYPLAQTAIGWQGALAISIIFIVIALLFWFPQLKQPDTSLQANEQKMSWRLFLTSPLAICVMLSMGLQSFLFYCITAWIPEIYIHQGLQAELAGWLITISMLAQIPVNFIIPIIATKMHSQRPIVLFFTLCYLISFLGISFEWTQYAIIWMIFLGFACGGSFSYAMMLFTVRTKTPYEAAELSGFSQSIGYLLAAIGPFLCGLLIDATSSFLVIYVIFFLISLFLGFAAYIAGANKLIRD